MAYRVELAPAAARNLRRVPALARDRLRPTILALADNPRPHGVRKVRGTDLTYRVRVGNYRVVYDVRDADQLVLILLVARRNESTYRRT